MKTRNPNNRYDLKIKRSANVLEVGGGHNPHPRANVVVDKFIDSNYHRHADIKVLKGQKFIHADGEDLPFTDKEFDYVICNQVLEHVENPQAFVNEQMRVAKAGYLEVPSLIGEYLFPKEAHKWIILEIEGKIVMVEKEKYWFKSNFDFGFLFLTWLQQQSIGYKILMKTHPNFMTMRYEWQDSMDIIVSPTDEKYLKYFREPWSPEMVQQFFPKSDHFTELKSSLKSFSQIAYRTLARKIYRVSPT